MPAGSGRDDLLARCVAWFAANGVGETSLRTLATAVGTSHRMLIYHFGSREGLLGAVVESVEQGERAMLARLRQEHEDPYAAGEAFWEHVADAASTFAPLFFELSGHAMQGQPWAQSLREWLAHGWTAALTDLWVDLGHSPAEAAVQSRANLAMVRGLLFDLAVTGERAGVDRTMEWAAIRLGAAPPG